MKLFRKILLALTIGFLSCITIFITCYLVITNGVRLDPQKLLMPDTQITLYDNHEDKIIGAGSFDRRNIVSIDKLPSYLPTAFINIEDKRFYHHNGFDSVGIARATLKNLKSRSFKEGASTISQQLIKNTHLSLDKTISRKLKEFKLTKQLEQKYSKSQILETYLNTIYFGHSCYGIADAAEFYFGKEATKLTLAESALLAGLVKSPNNYSPFKNPKQALKRRATVLNVMLEQKSINEAEYKIAIDSYLPTTSSKKSHHSYAHFAIQEMDQIFDELDIATSGKIELFTHFSPYAQQVLESQKDSVETDKTFIVVNNTTNGVEALYSTTSSQRRSPGSLIKPLLIYAPAFEEGVLSPASPILDEPTNFSGYSPKNYQDEYHGYVSARVALAKSLNIPAVKVLNSLNFKNVCTYAERMNLEIPKNDQNLSFALGGMEHGYPFSNLVDAYKIFANDGFFSPSKIIKEIKVNGTSVYTQKTTKQQVFSPETTYMITDTLKTATENGTAKRLRNLPFPIAAKTGTVGSSKGNTDAYTIAYTSEHTIGVWMGNSDYSAINTTGGALPCGICNSIAENLYATHLPEDFEKPTNVHPIAIDLYTYEREHRILRADPSAPHSYQMQELFASQYVPQETSSIFSNPTAPTPTIQLSDNGINIQYQHSPPDLYRYEILRSDGKKTATIYSGSAFQTFVDKNLQPNTSYCYTIIPYFEQSRGKPIVLPTVFLGENIPVPEITNKPWWEE